jgi:hypothetical protein
MQENKNRGVAKKLLGVFAILAVIAAIVDWYAHYSSRRDGAPVNKAFVRKLETAKHFKSEFPAQMQTIDVAKRIGFRSATLNAIGMEPRDVGMMATGSPESVFGMLSHLGGLGEIIWVDQWTNFPVKLPGANLSSELATKFLQSGNSNFQVKGLPPGTVPRREAVRAALIAIDASGGCLIKAGEHRYLVAKVSERKQYEAAICALGWLDGVSPPWLQETRGDHPNANSVANGTESSRSETNRASLTTDPRR